MTTIRPVNSEISFIPAIGYQYQCHLSALAKEIFSGHHAEVS